MFYVYVVGKFFITEKSLRLGKSVKCENARYWTNKGYALSWKDKILKKYPEATLEEAVLTLKNKKEKN